MNCSAALLATAVLVAFAGVSASADTHWTNDITSDTTWTLDNSPYFVDKAIWIYNGATLTVESGVEVRGASATYIVVGRNVNHDETDRGALIADGATFTSQSGEWGGWCGLYFMGNYKPTMHSNVTNCTIENSGGYDYYAGVTCYFHGDVTISGCTIRHNSVTGVSCDGHSEPTVVGNDFVDNGGVPLSLWTNAVAHTSGNTFAGNGTEHILVQGDCLTESGTWADQGIPYQLDDTVTICEGATLSLDPGVEVRAAQGERINVGRNSAHDASDQGGLIADGAVFTSANDTIGDWGGIWFDGQGYAPLESSLTGCTVRNSGCAINSPGIKLLSHSNVTVSECTIGPNAHGGVWCDQNSFPAVVGNLFTGNQDVECYPLYLRANGVARTSGNQFSGNEIDAIYVDDHMTESGTWVAQGAYYRLDNSMRVYNGATLTLEPGVEVKLWLTRRILVGRTEAYDATDRGALVATGATFSSYDDSNEGWSGILLDGRGYEPLQSSITGCTIKNSGSNGCQAIEFWHHSNATVSGCAIGPNAEGGIRCDENSLPAIFDNLFTGNDDADKYPLYLYANAVEHTWGNVFVDNDIDAIHVSGDLSESGVWVDQGVPYEISTSLCIYNSATLTLEPGVELFMFNNGMVTVGKMSSYDETDRGALLACGTERNPVHIGSRTGEPGTGTRLVFEGRGYSPLPSIVECCLIDGLGAGAHMAILVNWHDNVDFKRVTVVRTAGDAFNLWDSAPLIQNSIIAYSTDYGIWADGDTPPEIVYTCLWDNEDGPCWGCAMGEGCMIDDPEFEDPDERDYHLTAGSPCVDTGCGTAGDGTPIDMGAYQFGGWVAAPIPQPYGDVRLFGEPYGGYPGWVWFSIPLHPAVSADPSYVLGFDCSGVTYRWDKYGKYIQVYKPPFATWDLAPGDSYLLYLTGEVANPEYFGEPPDSPFEFRMGRQGWTWIGMPGNEMMSGPEFMSSVRVRYPSDEQGTVRTAQADYNATPNNWIAWSWSFFDTGTQGPKTFTPYAPFGNRDCYPWLGFRTWVRTGTAVDENDPDQVTLIWP
jgi:hypothetical protein